MSGSIRLMFRPGRPDSEWVRDLASVQEALRLVVDRLNREPIIVWSVVNERNGQELASGGGL